MRMPQSWQAWPDRWKSCSLQCRICKTLSWTKDRLWKNGITCKCKTSNGGYSLLLPGTKEHLPTEVSSFGMFLIFSKVFELGNIWSVNKRTEPENSEFGNITRPIIHSLSIVCHRSSCNFSLHSLLLSILCYRAYTWNQFVWYVPTTRPHWK